MPTRIQDVKTMSPFGRAAALVLGALTLCAGAEPAWAIHKHHPANNAICFDAALSKEDKSDCKKQMGAQTTADGRAKVRKAFKRKIAQTKAASAAPAPPAK